MNELPYKVGTIKLTWINPRDNTILESAMFRSVDEALKNLPTDIKRNDFLLFQLIQTDGEKYRWKLLNYGKFYQYKYGMEFLDSDLLFYGTLLFTVLGFLYIIKFVTK